MRPLPIIHINGFPGAGKLTIARKLVDTLSNPDQKLPETSPIPTKLVHNHLLIDPAGAILDREQPGYQDLRRDIRDALFKTIIGNESTHGTAYIFTDFQSQDGIGRAVCAEFKALAASRGSVFIPIVLSCEEGENILRVASPDRAIHSKLTDQELVRKFLRNERSVHRFDQEEAWMELDVTKLLPHEAAEIIATHIRKFVA